MKIAFDVKGTIEGYKKKQVLRMFELFQKAGHEVIVWSNSYSFAVDAIEDNELTNTRAESKGDKWNTSEENYYDLAIEDDRQQGQWLAAKKFVFVDDIPDEMVLVDVLVQNILGSSNETKI
jgi:siroheme synthase (precorrin-2 oxidase/ferrochelatase)